VTDDSWYRFLAARPEVSEVNFWQPSGGREFRVLAPGEPFFFKTHYPHNKVVGGGFFSDSARLLVSEAWEFFGPANGVASVAQMRACCCAPTSTPCSTAGTSASTPASACWSAPGCERTSATATSSTPRQARSSSYLSAAPTGQGENPWNGTSTRSSKPDDNPTPG
jgi:hypothetical protein